MKTIADLVSEINRLRDLLARAADMLADSPIEHANGCPVFGMCVCEYGKERVNFIDELLKAAE